MSIATKTMTKFLKKFKKTIFVVFFKMIKEHKSLIFAFPLKIKAFFIILSTKFISLNCTASRNSLASFLINTLLFYSKSKHVFLDTF